MPTRHALLPVLLLSDSRSRPAAGRASRKAPLRPPSPTAGAAATPAVHDGRKVEIIANDTMKFSIVEIRAKAGERLSVTLVNKGTTPKFSMGHNWVLLTLAANFDAFVLAAAESPTTEYVPAAKRAEILAATKLLGPASRTRSPSPRPATPGRYPFLCSFPGHSQVGMRGVLIVE